MNEMGRDLRYRFVKDKSNHTESNLKNEQCESGEEWNDHYNKIWYYGIGRHNDILEEEACLSVDELKGRLTSLIGRLNVDTEDAREVLEAIGTYSFLLHELISSECSYIQIRYL